MSVNPGLDDPRESQNETIQTDCVQGKRSP